MDLKQDDTAVTITVIASVTLAPKDAPTPVAGEKVIAERIEGLLARRGVVAQVHEVTAFTVSRSNPNQEEVFKPTLLRTMDRRGRPMSSRQVDVVESQGEDLPYHLVLTEGEAGARRFGRFATSYDAGKVGEMWQAGVLDVRMTDLPIFDEKVPQ